MENRGLERQIRESLQKRKVKSTFRKLTLKASSQIDFSSNDYLSLNHDNDFHEKYLAELSSNKNVADIGDDDIFHMGSLMGSGGSRLLDGNSQYVEALEVQISKFHGADTGLIFNSGFDANVSLFGYIARNERDIIVYDEYIHASVHDGMKISRSARKFKFDHNSVESLSAILKQVCKEGPHMDGYTPNIFIAVESVYSMDGDIAPLKELVECIERNLPYDNGYLIVDEAHATGVVGPYGKGLVAELNLEKKVYARVHTFGKALSCNGAIILCNDTLKQFLINYARPLIYTTSLSYYSLAAIKTSYEHLSSPAVSQKRAHLWNLIDYFAQSLANLSPKSALQVSHHATKRSSIFSLICNTNPRDLASYCQSNGIMVRPIVSPTVPRGMERLRVCLHAGNSFHDIDYFIGVINDWFNPDESKL